MSECVSVCLCVCVSVCLFRVRGLVLYAFCGTALSVLVQGQKESVTEREGERERNSRLGPATRRALLEIGVGVLGRL